MYLLEALKRRWKKSTAAPPSSASAPSEAPPPAEVVKFEKTEPRANTGIVPSGLGSTAVETLGSLAGLGGDIAGLAKTAVQVTRVVETVLDKGLGAGEGRASLAMLGGPAIVGVATAQLARKGLEAIGVKNEEVKKTVEQAVAAGPLAPAVLIAHGFSAGLRAISPEADRAVRDVVKLADISDPTQPLGAVYQGATNALKDLIGGKEDKPPPPPATAEQTARANELLAERGGLSQAGLGGLLSVAKQVRQETAPPPPAPPTPAPSPIPLMPAIKTLAAPAPSTAPKLPFGFKFPGIGL